MRKVIKAFLSSSQSFAEGNRCANQFDPLLNLRKHTTSCAEAGNANVAETALRAVIYTRVSTEEQNPRGQLEVVRQFCAERGYTVIAEFSDEASGSIDPFQRPGFQQLLRFLESKGADVVVMYDLTRFYRAASPTQALVRLRELMDRYRVFVDFAKEPEIDDPLLRELWQFLKSWFASYERLQTALRTRYGMLRVKREGRLYHHPGLVHYYAAWLYGKQVGEVTREELEAAARQLQAVVQKYWNHPGIKRTKLLEYLADHELRGMYQRFPHAPKSYYALRRFLAARSRA